jgi:DNA-binding transcriptional ArsR family regulator
MDEVYEIENLEQLRSISDPLRVKIIHLTGAKPMTSQMLSEQLDISRTKIHYHLKELEKNKLIEVVKTEQVRNFIQMFYQPVAQSIIAPPHLLLTEHNNYFDPLNVKLDENMANNFYKELKDLCKKFESKSEGNVRLQISLTKVK